MKILLKILLKILPFIISFGCIADSCYISAESVKELSALNQRNFTFNIKRTKNNGWVGIEVFLPKVLNGEKFHSIELAGISSKTNEPLWVIPIATSKDHPDNSLLVAELFPPENLLENAKFSISYGEGNCLLYMSYDVRQLEKNRNH
ncbi:hypothetical protein ACFO3I_01805 [Rheinheimera marina]|uniref:Lipoprotein n=1 Tax=Rheinheimera marina TaxID=1774958 RepID=A0ABV9JH31_9GAMM